MFPSPVSLCVPTPKKPSAETFFSPLKRNIVATVNLDCRLDLKTIALHARNADRHLHVGGRVVNFGPVNGAPNASDGANNTAATHSQICVSGIGLNRDF